MTTSAARTPEIITIGGEEVSAGTRHRVELKVARLPTGTWLSVPVQIVHGAKPGPNLWISAAVHGDEINGVEIIRRVLEKLDPKTLKGAVFAVPIVNVYGFIDQSRYLPDRRDLNRCFPGSAGGSLASRLAHLFMTEVVSQCSYGIDLHTGSNHRTNLPQIRGNLHDEETLRCAKAFRAPVIMHSQTRDGSLREAATEQGIHVLLYEAGEPQRFDEEAIQLGYEGVLRVMNTLGMRKLTPRKKRSDPIEIGKSSWVRARRSGIFRLQVQEGEHVVKKQAIGIIADAFGENSVIVKAPHDGLVIGHTNNPLVNQGDGVIHIGKITSEFS